MTRGALALAGLLVLAGATMAPDLAAAHCDGLDGPVVTAAREAFAKNEVARVLIWVQPKDEHEIREAFAQAVAVRKMGGPARELADRWFFETLVRVHRAGEGASFDGLKPAGRDVGPAIPAADRALTSGDDRPLVALVTAAAEHRLRDEFAAARKARDFAPADVGAGREYVARYVRFIHLVERLHAAATTPVAGHEVERAHAAGDSH